MQLTGQEASTIVLGKLTSIAHRGIVAPKCQPGALMELPA